MPFTFTHPAAILPVYKRSKRKDLLLPLAIGSMMPDFGYYFQPFEFFNENAHTITKSFSFCLPMGLLCLAVILFLQSGLISLLPNNKTRTFFYDHLPSNLSVKFVALASIAIIAGSWTHILWDGFTHKNGFLLPLIPFLKIELFPGLEVFRILQHVSTLVGAFFLYRFYRHYPVEIGAYNRRSWTFIIIANFLSLAFALKVKPFQWFYFVTAFIKMFILMTISVAAVIAYRRKELP